MLPIFEKDGFGNYTAIRKTDSAKIGCADYTTGKGLKV